MHGSILVGGRTIKNGQFAMLNDGMHIKVPPIVSTFVAQNFVVCATTLHQGAVAAIRVCRAAAKSVAIRNIARAEGGVTQREIMDWMNDPSTGSIFTDYERMMLTKIERKSFMSTCLKALGRAGYTKNEVKSGNAFRWNLPWNVSMSSCAVTEGVSSARVESKEDTRTEEINNLNTEEKNDVNNEAKQVDQRKKSGEEKEENTVMHDGAKEEGAAESGETKE